MDITTSEIVVKKFDDADNIIWAPIGSRDIAYSNSVDAVIGLKQIYEINAYLRENVESKSNLIHGTYFEIGA